MKKLVVGILAHVDAGKTTLSESLLYTCGSIRRAGRVDHGDTFLDTDPMERERGITIFSKQALLSLGDDCTVTLLDTPGHVDFSAEMERTLSVLDYAILVVSGADGVQTHTETLWQLLRRYEIPTFIFVNKMDIAHQSREEIAAQLRRRLDSACVDFGCESKEELAEQLALCDENLLAQYTEFGLLEGEDVALAIAQRKIFPCYFGSALKMEGVAEFADSFAMFSCARAYPAEFAARVFKISRDPSGNRLTFVKITGGALRVRTLLAGGDGPARWEEKVDQIRLYSGEKFRPLEEADAGTVCALTGLSHTLPGMGLGAEPDAVLPVLEPVLSFAVSAPKDISVHELVLKLRQLEEEDPMLRVVWDEELREIQLRLMGEIQLEVLHRVIEERFGVDVTFSPGKIIYKETIAAPVEGAGHFEPLRHYAEVHLLLEPGERGSGLQFGSMCGEDVLEGNWQRLILTHLGEKVHRGVLTGAPVTDLRIFITGGRAHPKHTEGGDFRQATYRAVRQGLMKAQSVLLEPYYDFRITLPSENVGKALYDISDMQGEARPVENDGETAVLEGFGPVSTLRHYPMELASYTKGRGRMACSLSGYRLCHNAAEVIAETGYQPEADLRNTPDSVFCANGAGYPVSWRDADALMHVQSVLRAPKKEEKIAGVGASRVSYVSAREEDRALQAIFERTYGPLKQRMPFIPQKTVRAVEKADGDFLKKLGGVREYLLVDGYNIIFAWDELRELSRGSLDLARETLIRLLINYQAIRKCAVIAVFDAYRVNGGQGAVEKHNGVYVVYTRQAQTADSYIEKVSYEIGGKSRVRVASSDGLEQLIVMGHGTLRMSAAEFREEMEQAEGEIAALIEKINRQK